MSNSQIFWPVDYLGANRDVMFFCGQSSSPWKPWDNKVKKVISILIFWLVFLQFQVY